MDEPLTITCPHCGKSNPEENAYCEQCHQLLSNDAPNPGAATSPASQAPVATFSVTDADPEPPPKPLPKVNSSDLRCKACGAPLKPTPAGQTVVCDYCGTAEVVEGPPTPPPEGPSTKGSWYDDQYWSDDEDDTGPGGLESGWSETARGLIRGIFFVALGLVFLATSALQQCSVDAQGIQTCPILSSDVLAGVGALVLLLGIGLCVYTYLQYNAWDPRR